MIETTTTTTIITTLLLLLVLPSPCGVQGQHRHQIGQYRHDGQQRNDDIAGEERQAEHGHQRRHHHACWCVLDEESALGCMGVCAVEKCGGFDTFFDWKKSGFQLTNYRILCH